MISARETNFLPCFWFFSRVKTIFLAHFYLNFLGHSEVFSGRFSDFFSVYILFFSAEISEFEGIFMFFTGAMSIFFSRAKNFFSRVEFSVFFPGTIFSSRAVFNIFSRAISNLLGRKIENFLGRDFFFLGKKKKTGLKGKSDNFTLCPFHH